MADPVTAESIAEAANQPASASVDGQAAAAHSIPDQILADQYRLTQAAAAGTNPAGGSRSGWSMTRAAKVVPPGAV